MIYLIDDKGERQKNLGWSKDVLMKYKEILIPIYTADILEEKRLEILNENNIIFYHESFFDNPNNFHKKSSLKIKQDLIDYSDKKSLKVVFFSGSIGARSFEKNRVSLPVGILYKNLHSFLDEYILSGQNINLKQIAYGIEYIKEEILEKKLKIWEMLKNDDVGNFTNNPQLNFLLEEYQKLTQKKLSLDSISIDYLKYQINKSING